MTLPTTLTTSFSVTAFGAISPSALGNRLDAVPIDTTLPDIWGLLLLSDSTATVGQVSTRTFVHLISPGEASASVSCTLETGEVGAPINAFSVDSPGDGYAARPILSVSPRGSKRNSIIYPRMQASSLGIIRAGTGYTPNATLNLIFSGGGLVPGGVQATGRVHISAGGVVDSVFLDTRGGFYNSPPRAVIDTTTGSGAYIQTALNVAGLQIVDYGEAWTTAPAVTVTPLYYKQCGTDFLGPMRDWMTGQLEAALQTTVLAATPVAA